MTPSFGPRSFPPTRLAAVASPPSPTTWLPPRVAARSPHSSPPSAAHPYPLEVHHRIRQDEPADYLRTARDLDRCVDVVSIQHEYGIWGGEDGEWVLDFVRRPEPSGGGHAPHRAPRSDRPPARDPERARRPRRGHRRDVPIRGRPPGDVVRRGPASGRDHPAWCPGPAPRASSTIKDGLGLDRTARSSSASACWGRARATSSRSMRCPRSSGTTRTSCTSSSGRRTRTSSVARERPTGRD